MTGEGGTTAPGTPTDAAPTPARAGRRPATSLLTWATVALVLVVVIVLVVVKVTGSPAVPTPTTPPAPSPAPSAVVQAVTHIPASVYDAVGVTSPVAAVTPPLILRDQPALESRGKPEVVFVGDEFCPYCAAERWSLVAALSRFGSFSSLDSIQSGSNEAFPSTPTFTFAGARYKSSYVSAVLVEHYGDVKNGAGTGYAVLEPIPDDVKALMTAYDKPTPATPRGTVPFLDISNRAVVAGGDFSPSILQDLSDTDIAAALRDPTDPATQAIVATANDLTSVVCEADGQQPASVCTSRGVSAAAAALGLSR